MCISFERKLEEKQLEVKFVSTEEQIADVLTKPLTAKRFEFLREKLIVEDSPLKLWESVKEGNS